MKLEVVKADLEKIGVYLRPDSYQIVKDNLPEALENPERAEEMMELLDEAESGKRQAKKYIANIVQVASRAKYWIAGTAVATAAALAGWGFYAFTPSAPEPNQPTPIVRTASLEHKIGEHIHYQENENGYQCIVPKEVLGRSTDYTFTVEKDAMENFKETLSRVEKNDANKLRIPDYWMDLRPNDIITLTERIMTQDSTGGRKTITTEDARKALEIIGLEGGMRELGGNYQ